MKYFVQILFYLLLYGNLNAQNLITNPSFEDINSCYGQPAGIGLDVFDWSGCTGWSCPTQASSDLWCPFSSGGIQPPNLLGVGYQYPRSGDNFGGILMFQYSTQNYREYIQNELAQPLLAGQYYKLSVYVSATEDSINYSSCIQAYFSNTPISASNFWVLPLIPQWKNADNNFILDTLGWQLLTGVFKANGGEKFAILGCFEDSANVEMLDKNPFTTSEIYYFIDDVVLEEASIQITFPNVFTPNNDGVNDVFQPTLIGLSSKYEVIIYNRWGNVMDILDENQLFWDGKRASEGTYFYVLKDEKLNIDEQGFFQLIR